MTNNRLQLYFYFTILLVVTVLAFLIFLPYLSSIAVAGILAVTSRPLYKKLAIHLRNKSLAALTTIVLIGLVIVIPIGFFGYLVFQEAQGVYQNLYSKVNGGHEVGGDAFVLNSIENTMKALFPEVAFDVEKVLQQGVGWFVNSLGGLFSGLVDIMISVFLGIIALFYLLRDGKHFMKTLEKLSPLDTKYEIPLFSKMGEAINSVVKGSLIVALIQGLVAGIGFFAFGIPNPALWAGVTAITALIPGIGTSLVTIPAVIYLFGTGNSISGIGMLAWATMAVGLIDNFLGPKIIGKKIRVHPFIVLLSVLGGIGLFGAVGFLLGPLTMSLLFALFDLYPKVANHAQKSE